MALAWATGLAWLLAGLGLAQAVVGWLALRRFARAPRPLPVDWPAVTILKPLHGDEPLLDWALSSMCGQNYPAFQVVFGVHAAGDAALAAVERVRATYPGCDIAVVVDPTQHGANQKIGNLINMLAAARHDVLVIADSDVHAAPDWLERVVATLQQDAVGLATTPYVGFAGVPGWVARLGAMQISHVFLPGALLGRALGRQDCLGATMALRRDVLERVGGLAAIADELADDAILGRLVARTGRHIGLVPSLPATTVPETRLAALWHHELRWARTVRSLAPVGHAASVLQYPLAWALLAVLLAGLAWWAVLGFALAWLARAELARRSDRTILGFGGLASRPSYMLLPMRDVLSVAVIVASFAGQRVTWRGQTMSAARVGGVW